MIRSFQKEDTGQLLEIYNHYVKTSISTLDIDEVNLETFSKEMERIASRYPFIVYTKGKQVLAYAYVNLWKAKQGYDKTVESTVYIHESVVGQGIGTLMYRHLNKILKTKGYQCVIACLSLPNAISVALHEKIGFNKVAHFPGIAVKFDKKIDVGYWQLDIV
ncbi:MAG: N-acetyltransferase [Flavobacteriales bacterium]|nr:N-acetyltransferase [Flavobacteriales bacterium]